MRNLKKILSLVLALMMVMSLMVTASAATFTDDADIEYKEAVEVMAAAGVLNGKGDGEFDPKGSLTRAEAAKIVAYVLLGSDVQYLSNETATQFADVTANHKWAWGSINYCVSEGIIAGVGNGNYEPNNALTGTAFAKMLLVALGIDGEYTGTNWEFNVKKAANATNPALTDNLPRTLNLSGAITREQAAQMAFNAMQVVADGASNGYYYDDPSISAIVFDEYLDAWLFADSVMGDAFDAKKIKEDKDVTSSLLYANFGIYEGEAGTDEWGNPESKVWVTLVKGEEVDVYVEDQAIAASFTSKVTDKALAAALGIKEDAAKALNVTANGKLVNYFKSGSSYEAVVVNYTVAELAITEKDGDVTYTVGTVSGVDYKDAKKADTVALHGDVVKGAVVTYAVDNTGVCHIYPTSTVEGVLESKTAATQQLTIGGTKYALSAAAGAKAYADYNINSDLGKKADQYAVDQYGYVVGLATDAAPAGPTENIPTQFVYLLAYETRAYSAGTTTGESMLNPGTTTGAATAAAKAKVVHTDGTVEIVDLCIYKAADKKTDMIDLPVEGKITSVALADNPLTEVGTWFGYEVNEDGTYTLVDLNEKTAQVVDTKTVIAANRTGKLEGKYWTNSNTTISAMTLNDKNEVVVKNVSGLQSVEVTVDVGTLIVYAQNATVVSAVYGYTTVSFGEASTAPEVTKPDYYYIAGEGDEVLGGVKYTVYVNGKTETVVISNAVELNTVCTLTADKDEKGELTGTYTASELKLHDAGKVGLTDTTFFVADAEYYYDKNCEIYDVTAEGAKASIEAGDNVWVLADKDGVVSLVYITVGKWAKYQVVNVSLFGDQIPVTVSVNADMTEFTFTYSVMGNNITAFGTISGSTWTVVSADPSYMLDYANQMVGLVTANLGEWINY